MHSLEEKIFAVICALIYLALVAICFYDWAGVPKTVLDMGGHFVGISTVANQIKLNPYGTVRFILIYGGVLGVYAGCLKGGWLREMR
jgi:hypothetical protein